MKLGLSLRLMGAASRSEVIVACARTAEDANLDELWVPDHIAIPPDDAEGSDGRYLDPLTSLAHLAALTRNIGLGTGVLILPYRSALPTLKAIATVQELSGNRMRLGIGVGWMKSEFKALGIDRSQRGRTTDRTLDLFRRCFDADDDVVTEHGQSFLFRPRPSAPPVFIGGSGRHALERVVRFGDGWMPMGANPDTLGPEIATLRELADAAGRKLPEVVVLGALTLQDPQRAASELNRLAELGVTRFVTGSRYSEVDEFAKQVEAMVRVREALG